MAKISRMEPGQELYEVRRQKMGNTTVSRGVLFRIRIIEVDPEGRWVLASWNSNPVCKYRQRDADAWRVSKPKPKGVIGGMPCY
jgi:hypothetical protein